MKLSDVAWFAWRSIWSNRARTLLMVLAMAIGVAAVVVLTSLGEGARRYVRLQFETLGTNLIIVLPGRAETSGSVGGILSGRTPRDLTLDDAMAVSRIPGVLRVLPVNLVSGEVSRNSLSRDVPVVGSTRDLKDLWRLDLARGEFLPVHDPRRATFVCVIGSNVQKELFGSEPAVGSWVRVADRRFRVIGVLESKGQFLGIDVNDAVIIPVASAQMVFNLPSLLRMAVEAERHDGVPRIREEIKRVIRQRHDGEEDVTVVTQDALSSTFDTILVALTMALGGIASISLGVAGILIMNVMLIAVTQRTGEIGLLKALGASPSQIRRLFFAEAAVLSMGGGVVGSVVGQAGSFVVRRLYPAIPAFAPIWAVAAAFAIALATGISFSVLPARRAASLDAAAALARR